MARITFLRRYGEPKLQYHREYIFLLHDEHVMLGPVEMVDGHLSWMHTSFTAKPVGNACKLDETHNPGPHPEPHAVRYIGSIRERHDVLQKTSTSTPSPDRAPGTSPRRPPSLTVTLETVEKILERPKFRDLGGMPGSPTGGLTRQFRCLAFAREFVREIKGVRKLDFHESMEHGLGAVME